jgi:hypothetical protein
MFAKNEGPADRTIRVVAGIVLIAVGLSVLAGLDSRSERLCGRVSKSSLLGTGTPTGTPGGWKLTRTGEAG